MTQERLADLALISRNYVGDVERGVKSPTLATVQRLANALEVEPHVLVRAAERVSV
jgi:transcriptional regulator with XRE-family HTH domain